MPAPRPSPRFQHVVGMRRLDCGNQSACAWWNWPRQETSWRSTRKFHSMITRFTATKTSRKCAIERGGTSGNRAEQVHLNTSSRRQQSVPCQRRRPGDGDDGHHPGITRQSGNFLDVGRREQGAGDGGVQNHFAGPEPEGDLVTSLAASWIANSSRTAIVAAVKENAN